jgi:hypothetical protein
MPPDAYTLAYKSSSPQKRKIGPPDGVIRTEGYLYVPFKAMFWGDANHSIFLMSDLFRQADLWRCQITSYSLNFLNSDGTLDVNLPINDTTRKISLQNTGDIT